MSILAIIEDLSIEEVSLKYKSYNHKEFKTEVADKVANFILDIQNRFYQYRNDEAYLKQILTKGAKKAKVIANEKMEEVKQKVGLKL